MKVLEFVRHSALLSLLAIAAIVVALQVPIHMIVGLVDERRATRDEAVTSVTQGWGAPQTLIAPILAVPYAERGAIRHAYFLPETLRIDGDIDTQRRSRGIFSARLYSAALRISGTFSPPDFSSWTVDPADIQWSKAALLVGLSDPKALRSPVKTTWDGRPLDFASGIPGGEPFKTGIHAPVAVPNQSAPHEFSIEIGLGGVDSLQFVPMGSSTIVSLKSSWPDPSFIGTQLPAAREVTPRGFAASWQILSLTRNFPNRWLQGAVPDGALAESAFGVNFMAAVDTYKMAERSIKYQMLFFVLTFTVFYAFEFFTGLRLHVVQYLLVGAALCLFYLLLLSLSEHASFPWAYLAAAVGVVALIGGYSWAVLRTGGRAGIVAAMLAGLYAFLYTLLQLSDYALLGGSIALFIILGLVMFATRRFDWYRLAPQG